MTRTYLVVGHGGQGVLDLGNFIAYDAMLSGFHVAYTPSYGPETRGGKVRCYVVKSTDEIESPIVEEPDVLVAMNNPSMDFEPLVRSKGLLLLNNSLVDRAPTRSDIQIVPVPATELADQLKGQYAGIPDTRVLQNSVAYGALLAAEAHNLDENAVQLVLEHAYIVSKARFIPANLAAVRLGFDSERQNVLAVS